MSYRDHKKTFTSIKTCSTPSCVQGKRLFIPEEKWSRAASQFNKQIRVGGKVGRGWGDFKPVITLNENMWLVEGRLELWGLGPPFFGPTCGMGPPAAVSSAVFGRTCSSINFLDSEGLTTLNCLSPQLPEGTTTHSSQNKENDFDFLPVFTHNIV